MGAEKVDSKSSSVGNFFQLLNWRRKSVKKLLSIENDSSSARQNQGEQPDRIDENEVRGSSSLNECSEYSRSSSFTEAESHSIRAPGVIARLMGLDSIHTAGMSEPYSTPMYHLQPIWNERGHIRTPEMQTDDPLSKTPMISDASSGKQVELHFQRMPSSRIGKLQPESQPPLAKAISVIERNLLSPVSSNMDSTCGRSATLLTEAKTRESDFQNDDMTINQSSQLISSSSRVHQSIGIISSPKKASELPESKKRTKSLGSIGSLKGRPLNKSSYSSENPISHHRLCGTSSSNSRAKEKSISLAVQAKVNVQKRANLNSESREISTAEGNDQHKLNILNRLKGQKSNQYKKASAAGVFSVLRQSNQKQNYHVSGNSNLVAKVSASHKQEINIASKYAYYCKKDVTCKHEEDSKFCPSNEDVEDAQDEKEGSLTKIVKLTRSRKSVEQQCLSLTKGPTGNRGVAKHDVVSFTFTAPIRKSIGESQASPIRKLVGESQASCNEIEKLDMKNESDNHGFSTSEVNVVEADCLGKVIEKKLKELSYGIHSPYTKLVKGCGASLSSAIHDNSSFTYIPNASDLERNRSSFCSSSGDRRCAPSECELQDTEITDNFNGTLQFKELDSRVQYPFDTTQSSFSSNHCYPSKSRASSNGTEAKSHSSPDAQYSINWKCIKDPSLPQLEINPSDSVPPLSMGSSSAAQATNLSQCTTSLYQDDLEYVKEILSGEFMFGDLVIHPVQHFIKFLDPLLFDKLEENKSFIILEEEESQREQKKRRRLLFDSVSECLAAKQRHYFSAGYQSWAKGTALVRQHLAEEIYKEISWWRIIGDCFVDELIDKDMSTDLGKWICFDIEAFRAGVEIGIELLNSLVEDAIADLHTMTLDIPTQCK